MNRQLIAAFFLQTSVTDGPKIIEFNTIKMLIVPVLQREM